MRNRELLRERGERIREEMRLECATCEACADADFAMGNFCGAHTEMLEARCAAPL